MKKLVTAGVALALAAGMVSCSSKVSTTPLSSETIVENDFGTSVVSIVEIPDGERTVTCAVITGFRKGGISCDWAGAR